MEVELPQPIPGESGQEVFPKSNGALESAFESAPSDCLAVILQSLQTMKDGDFSVRLPVTWIGLPGKIADSFNEIVTANEQMALELKRVGKAVGKEGKTRERIRFQQIRSPSFVSEVAQPGHG